MKKIFIRDINQYLEREINELFYLRDVTFSTTDGGKWMDFHLIDVSGNVIGKCWSENMKEEYYNYPGKVVRVLGRIELYRDVYGIRIVDVRPVRDNEYDPGDFQIRLPDDEIDRLEQRLHELINSITDNAYNALLQAVFTPGRIKRFVNLPGDGCFHHVYTGGWLQHTIAVAEIALFVKHLCSNNPVEVTKADYNLLLTGALLFDVGKINSYTQQRLAPSLTLRGRLVGHIQDSLIFISCMNNNLQGTLKVADLTKLLHIVASAHRSSEIKPMTKEAVIISQANAISAAHAAYDELFYNFDKWHPEEDGKRHVYSKYFETDMVRSGKGDNTYVR